MSTGFAGNVHSRQESVGGNDNVADQLKVQEAGAHARSEALPTGVGDRSSLNAISSMESSASGSDGKGSAVSQMLDNFSLVDDGKSNIPASAGPESHAGGESGAMGAAAGAAGGGGHASAEAIGLSQPPRGESVPGPGSGGGGGGAGGADRGITGGAKGATGLEQPPRMERPETNDHYQEITQPGGGDASSNRADVSLPTAEQLAKEPISDLIKTLDTNNAELVKKITEQLPDMPAIGFHGTSAENAAGIEQSKTSEGNYGKYIYAATNVHKDTDPAKYATDMNRNIQTSITAGDLGQPAESIMVLNTGNRTYPDGNYVSVSAYPQLPEYTSFAGASDNQGKTTVSFNPDNYNQVVLGSVDASQYESLRRAPLDQSAPDYLLRRELQQAFVGQGLEADVLEMLSQKQQQQEAPSGEA